MLNSINAIEDVAGLLTSSITRVKVKALAAICAMCYENENVCQSLLNGKILSIMLSKTDQIAQVGRHLLLEREVWNLIPEPRKSPTCC